MIQIVVPHWFAQHLIRQHGSLQAAQEHYGIKIVDDYWAQLADETEERMNNASTDAGQPSPRPQRRP